VISLNRRITIVRTPAERIILRPSEIPRIGAYIGARIVFRALAEMFTILLQVKMVLSNFSLLSNRCNRIRLFFLFDFSISIRSISLSDMNAVSIPEKKPERTISINNMVKLNIKFQLLG